MKAAVGNEICSSMSNISFALVLFVDPFLIQILAGFPAPPSSCRSDLQYSRSGSYFNQQLILNEHTLWIIQNSLPYVTWILCNFILELLSENITVLHFYMLLFKTPKKINTDLKSHLRIFFLYTDGLSKTETHLQMQLILA